MTADEVDAAIQRNDPAELRIAVLSASLHSNDSGWAESVCLKLATHADPHVRGNAILGFGHLARRLRRLDQSRVQVVVRNGMQDPDEVVRGHSHDAADDISQALGWSMSPPGESE